MPRTRPPYPEEFRNRIVELAQNGRTPRELAEEFEPAEQTIRNLLKQADRDDSNRSDEPTTEEKEEIRAPHVRFGNSRGAIGKQKLDQKRCLGGGRPRSLSEEEIPQVQTFMNEEDVSTSETCERFGISKATLYRYVGPDGERRR